MHRTDTDVVERCLLRGEDLLGGVRRGAEQLFRPDRRARLREFDAVPVDVHAVRSGGRHELRTVVEHQQRAVALAGRPQPCRDVEDLCVAPVALQQLDDVDAALQSSVEPRLVDRFA